MPHIVLPYRVQVQLGLVPRYPVYIVVGKHFDGRLEGALVLAALPQDRVVERPDENWQNDRLDADERAMVHAVFEEAHDRDALEVARVVLEARGESASAICATRLALEPTIENADEGPNYKDKCLKEEIANEVLHHAALTLRDVQVVVVVAARTENSLRVDDVRREAVAVDLRIGTRARLDEFGRNFQLLQVSLSLDVVDAENSHKFRLSGFRQSIHFFRACEHWLFPPAEITLAVKAEVGVDCVDFRMVLGSILVQM